MSPLQLHSTEDKEIKQKIIDSVIHISMYIAEIITVVKKDCKHDRNKQKENLSEQNKLIAIL
jgi:hypothetical protein